MYALGRPSDCGVQIHVDAQRGGLRHDVSHLTLEAIEESCAFGEDCVSQRAGARTFLIGGGLYSEERERRLLLSWAKAGKDSKESREATRSEGDDLDESAARALMRHRGRGRGVRGEGRR